MTNPNKMPGVPTITSIPSGKIMVLNSDNEIEQISTTNLTSVLQTSFFSQDLNQVVTSSTTETTFRNYIISSNKLYAFNAGGVSIPHASLSTIATLRFYFNGVNIFQLANNLGTGASNTYGWTINIRVTEISNTVAGIQIVGAVNGSTSTTASATYKYITGVNFSSIAFSISGQVSNAGSMTIYNSDDLIYPF